MTDKEIKTVYELLNYLQVNINAPKNQLNKFGNYKYRNVEDIMEAIKPLIKTIPEAYVFVNDDLIQTGDRFYIKATATIGLGDKQVSNTAYAREALEKKGMDCSQITGATSSYARKYALGGLLLVDDNKDADSDNNKKEEKPQGVEVIGGKISKDIDQQPYVDQEERNINTCKNLEQLESYKNNNYKLWCERFSPTDVSKLTVSAIIKSMEFMTILKMNEYFEANQVKWKSMFTKEQISKITESMDKKRKSDLKELNSDLI